MKQLLFFTILVWGLISSGCGTSMHTTSNEPSGALRNKSNRTAPNEPSGDSGDKSNPDANEEPAEQPTPAKEWYDNGELKAEGHYVDEERSGEWVEYHPKGYKQAVGHYESGRRTGKWIFYHHNGEKRASGHYDGGRRVGDWTFWTAVGDRFVRLTYGAEGVKREYFDLPESSDNAKDDSQNPDADPANLSAVILAHNPPLQSCFERALRDQPKLSVEVVATVQVGLRGEVANLELDSTPKMPFSMEMCFSDVLQAMQFDPPSGGKISFTKTFILRVEE